MRKPLRIVLAAFLLLFGTAKTYAQYSIGGTPKSFDAAFDQVPMVSVTMPGFDVAAMIAEDDTINGKGLRPYRFGYNHSVSLDPQNSGAWMTLPNGDRLWRLMIQSPGAFSINLGFSYYELPVDAKLFVFSADRKTVYGAFTHQNNNEEHVFATDLIPGSAIIVEYFEPSHVNSQSSFVIDRVTHAYRDVFGIINEKGFGDAGSCQFNSVCPLSAGWEEQIRSSVMLVSGGNGFCSGALINNTNNDGKPYVLTADHCMGGSTAGIVFRFKWESKTCPNPPSAPTPRSVNNPGGYFSYTGAILRASNAGSDFALLEMTGIPGNQFAANDTVYFSGWNRDNTPATASYGIHHPSGDIKKFSIANNATISATYAGASCWRVGQWTSGCTEGGSSGSPLYDQNKRIVGQLYGGPSYCGAPTSQMNDYYGKLATSWNGTSSSNRLRDWLDPGNTNVTVLDGFNPLTPQFALDASAVSVISPVAASATCSTSVVPEIRIRNVGSNPLTSVNILYRANNSGPWNTFNWTGNLNYNATANVVLPAISGFADGNVLLTFKTQNPNNGLDQNPSNDSVLVNFTKSITRDALPVSVISPAPNYQSCIGTISPVFSLKNQGCDALTSLTVQYRYDANPNQTFNWTGNLANGASTTVTLPDLTGIPAGAHTLTIVLSNPNGNADQNTANDQIVATFDIISLSNLTPTPVFNGFETTVFPGQGFTVVNPNANNTWARIINNSGFGGSTACTRIDLFTLGTNGSGQSDFLMSPFMNFSAASAQTELAFNYAYRQKTSANIDSLIVGVSTNCGETWNRVWAKGGFSLSTASGTTSTAFTPNAEQWQTALVNLGSFAGESDVLIRFQAKSGGGNNIWLDDINIAVNALGLAATEQQDFMLFPNPAAEKLTIKFAENLNQASLNLRDAAGRLVMNLPFQNQNQIEIDLHDLSNGLYFVEIQSIKGISTQRLIVNHK